MRAHASLQKIIPAAVDIDVAIIAGHIIAAGLAEPYWLRYAIIFTGISWIDEIFITRNAHIASLALSGCSVLSSDRDFIAIRPAGVAAHPSPRN